MKVLIDVLTPMPENWEMCQTCGLIMKQANFPGDNSNESFPQDWQEEFQKTSTMIINLAEKFGAMVKITIYDPRSIQGIIKALRYGVHRYPAFIINKKKYIGYELDRVFELVTQAGGIPLQARSCE